MHQLTELPPFAQMAPLLTLPCCCTRFPPLLARMRWLNTTKRWGGNHIGPKANPPRAQTVAAATITPLDTVIAQIAVTSDNTALVAQHVFYVGPRLRRWKFVWFAMSYSSVMCCDLPRLGHRHFGNVDSFW